MGCCYSHEKETVYEVTLDADGVAQRVSKGQGTHFIHISENNETHLEEKSTHQITSPQPAYTNANMKGPSLSTPPAYNSNKRVHPIAKTSEEKIEP